MKRQSYITGDAIVYSFWLAFDEHGGLRMTRTQPGLDRGERAMALSVKIPRSIFRTPQLSAKIEIADSGTPIPTIDIAAASAALKSVVGCDIDIRISEPVSE